MALLGPGWQEKVGPLRASGSSQGGDQTQGSHKAQGRALSIVLHRAEAAVTAERGVPARAQAAPAPHPLIRLQSCPTEVPLLGFSAPQDRPGSQRSCPFPVLLPTQSVPAESLLPREDQSCREPCSEHAQRGQDLSLEGKTLSADAEALVPVAHTPQSLLEVFSHRGMEARLLCHCPAASAGQEGQLQSSCLQGQPGAACQQRPSTDGKKNRNRKALKSLPQPSCRPPVIPSLRPLPCPDRQATPGPLGNHIHPPRPITCSSQSCPPRSPVTGATGGMAVCRRGPREPCSHPSVSQAGSYAIAFPQTQGTARRDLCRTAWKKNKPALELCKIVCHSEGLAIWVSPSLTLEDMVWARMPAV